MKFLFFLIPFLVFSQEKIAKGVVLDKETNAPIPYVNISILESTIGASSDDDGSYSINIKEDDIDKKIHLSSLGYSDTMLTVSSFLKLKTIFLKPLIEELDEVVIAKKFEEKLLTIQPFEKKDLYGGFGSGKRPWQLGLYFPYDSSYANTEYVKKITILLNKNFGYKKKPSKFRLRIFSVSKDSLPNQDLLRENIIVTSSKKQKEITVDIANYGVVFPREGIFVTLEGLAIPFNEVKRTYTMVDVNGKKSKIKNEIAYLPSFRAFLSEPNRFLVVHYGNGKWWKYPFSHPEKNKQFVPAISLTLSN